MEIGSVRRKPLRPDMGIERFDSLVRAKDGRSCAPGGGLGLNAGSDLRRRFGAIFGILGNVIKQNLTQRLFVKVLKKRSKRQ